MLTMKDINTIKFKLENITYALYKFSNGKVPDDFVQKTEKFYELLQAVDVRMKVPIYYVARNDELRSSINAKENGYTVIELYVKFISTALHPLIKFLEDNEGCARDNNITILSNSVDFINPNAPRFTLAGTGNKYNNQKIIKERIFDGDKFVYKYSGSRNYILYDFYYTNFLNENDYLEYFKYNLPKYNFNYTLDNSKNDYIKYSSPEENDGTVVPDFEVLDEPKAPDGSEEFPEDPRNQVFKYNDKYIQESFNYITMEESIIEMPMDIPSKIYGNIKFSNNEKVMSLSDSMITPYYMDIKDIDISMNDKKYYEFLLSLINAKAINALKEEHSDGNYTEEMIKQKELEITKELLCNINLVYNPLYIPLENPVLIGKKACNIIRSDYFILGVDGLLNTELPLIKVNEKNRYFMNPEDAYQYAKQLEA